MPTAPHACSTLRPVRCRASIARRCCSDGVPRWSGSAPRVLRLEQVIGDRGDGFECPMTRQDLAIDWLGLVLETVSRNLNVLAKRRLIEIRHHTRFKVLDRRALRTEAGQTADTPFGLLAEGEAPTSHGIGVGPGSGAEPGREMSSVGGVGGRLDRLAARALALRFRRRRALRLDRLRLLARRRFGVLGRACLAFGRSLLPLPDRQDRAGRAEAFDQIAQADLFDRRQRLAPIDPADRPLVLFTVVLKLGLDPELVEVDLAEVEPLIPALENTDTNRASSSRSRRPVPPLPSPRSLPAS